MESTEATAITSLYHRSQATSGASFLRSATFSAFRVRPVDRPWAARQRAAAARSRPTARPIHRHTCVAVQSVCRRDFTTEARRSGSSVPISVEQGRIRPIAAESESR